MDNFRLSNKKIYNDKRSSIENLHDEKINDIVTKENTLPELKQRLVNLKNLLSMLEKNKTIYKINETKREIVEIEDKIYKIENNFELVDYIYSALPFIEKFTEEEVEQNKTVKKEDQEEQKEQEDQEDQELEEKHKINMTDFINKTGKLNKGSDYQKYVDVCIHNRCYITEEQQIKSNICELCKEHSEFVLDYKCALRICSSCGNSVPFIEGNENSLYYSDTTQMENITQPFSYQRRNHFKEWLYQLQAKEVTQIPDIVIELLLLEIKKERITDIDDINSEKIKRYLKKLKLNKYYEHIPNIISKITDKPALNIDAEFEKTLLELFDKIQKPFEKHCPKSRKNFLNYSYTLHKFCQLLGKNEYLIYFPLLKSREKLFEQEKIWKNICADLGWNFMASV